MYQMINSILTFIGSFIIASFMATASSEANSQGFCYTINNTTICDSSNNRSSTIIKGQGNTSYIYDNTIKQSGGTYPNTIGDTRSNDEYYNNNKQQKRDPFTR